MYETGLPVGGRCDWQSPPTDRQMKRGGTSNYRLEGKPQLVTTRPARAGTFRALIEAYQSSPEWAGHKTKTRTEWARYRRVIAEHWGDLDVKALEPKHVKALRDGYADVPPADPSLSTKPLEEYRNRRAAANNLVNSAVSGSHLGCARGLADGQPGRRHHAPFTA